MAVKLGVLRVAPGTCVHAARQSLALGVCSRSVLMSSRASSMAWARCAALVSLQLLKDDTAKLM